MKELSKGVSIMKKRKLFTTLLMLLLLFVFIAPTMAKASEVTNGIAQTGTLTLHKFEHSIDDDMIPTDGTGMPGQIVPDGATALPGVLFRVTRVADDAALPDPAALAGEGAYMTEKTTDVNGLAVFATLPMGRYFVEEISGPANITTPTPDFLIDIPMMNTDRVSWNWDVHVYPKNETKYGRVALTKTVEGMAMPAGKSATFTLWSDKAPLGISGLDVRYPDAATTFTTDASGKIVVSGLPVGSYYFVETIPPEGYALDNTPVMFTIIEHSYLEDDVWVNLVSVSMDDKLKPTITKDITTVGQKIDSGGYADPVTWIIRPSIPTNISTYTSFVITDPIDSRLDFITGAANLEVSVAGTPRLVFIRDTDYTVTEPVLTNPRPVPNNLVITFTAAGRAKLAGKTDLQIRFKTTINETAVMGAEIPNTATVSYDNGFGQTGTATVPTPEIPVAWTGGYKFLKINDAVEPITLAGAEFKVYKVVGETKWYFTGTAWSEDILNGKIYTTIADGVVDIKGLPAGTYFLLETKAPMNTTLNLPYNLLRAPIEFEVTKTSYTAGMTNIINKMGPKIPQTGGIGTLLFSVIGLGLMGSAVMISRKKSTR